MSDAINSTIETLLGSSTTNERNERARDGVARCDVKVARLDAEIELIKGMTEAEFEAHRAKRIAGAK